MAGGAPDPADVTPASGLVKYEITSIGWIAACPEELEGSQCALRAAFPSDNS